MSRFLDRMPSTEDMRSLGRDIGRGLTGRPSLREAFHPPKETQENTPPRRSFQEKLGVRAEGAQTETQAEWEGVMEEQQQQQQQESSMEFGFARG